MAQSTLVQRISELTLNQLIGIITVLTVAEEPEHGFTFQKLFREIHSDHPGSKNDLLQRLKALRKQYPGCYKKRKYWGVPDCPR